MREPSKNDYSVQVSGIGNFIFARRTLNDEIAIQVERSKILDGTEHPTDFLWNIAVWVSALRILIVKAPAGWDLDELDPLETETFDQISRVFVEMRKKKTPFEENLIKQAKSNARKVAKSMGFWFRRKYNLPPNDPRYLSLTTQEIVEEYWAHHYAENGVVEEVEDDDFDADEEIRRINDEAEAAAADGAPDDWEEVDLNE